MACVPPQLQQVLVCGASGLLGRHVWNWFKDRGVPCVGTYRTSAAIADKLVCCDVSNAEQVRQLFEAHKPTVCVNCVAQRFIDECENDWAATKSTNIDAVAILADQCAAHNVHLIHISTDYVFDGTKPPYLPNSPPNPLQNYGISKLVGEMRLKASKCNKYTIIRVPVLYSHDYKELTETAVTVIGKKVMNTLDRHKEDDVSVRRPVYIPDLCHFIHWVVNDEEHAYDMRTLHFANYANRFTKYEIAKMIAEYLGKPSDHIAPDIPSATALASRPMDTCLTDTTLQLIKFPMTPLHTGIQYCFEKFRHPRISDCNYNNDIFLLLDLDGTLIDSEQLHLSCYIQAFQDLGLEGWHLDVFRQGLSYTVENGGNVDEVLSQFFSHDHDIIRVIKQKKQELVMDTTKVDFMPGMEALVELIHKNNINHAVVTNTTRQSAQHFQSILPALSKLKNWVTREDCTHSKPHPEPYQLAKSRFWKDEHYIIGFENSIVGYRSLKSTTDLIYILMPSPESKQAAYFRKQDVYLVSDIGRHL